jgi:hypothetical protein
MGESRYEQLEKQYGVGAFQVLTTSQSIQIDAMVLKENNGSFSKCDGRI